MGCHSARLDRSLAVPFLTLCRLASFLSLFHLAGMSVLRVIRGPTSASTAFLFACLGLFYGLLALGAFLFLCSLRANMLVSSPFSLFSHTHCTAWVSTLYWIRALVFVCLFAACCISACIGNSSWLVCGVPHHLAALLFAGPAPF